MCVQEMKTSTYFALTIAVITLAGLLLTLGYPATASTFPILIGIPLLIGAISQVIIEIRGKGKEVAGKAEGGNAWLHLVTVAWIGALPLVVYILGFFLGAAVYTVAYIRLQKKGWVMATALAAGVVAIYYVGFVLALKVPLYKGLLFSFF